MPSSVPWLVPCPRILKCAKTYALLVQSLTSLGRSQGAWDTCRLQACSTTRLIRNSCFAGDNWPTVAASSRKLCGPFGQHLSVTDTALRQC